jgi:hypothetical protein
MMNISCPLYQNSRLIGQVFNSKDGTGAIASMDTGFYVTAVCEYLDWPLGDLLERQEFLLLFEGRSYSLLEMSFYTLIADFSQLSFAPFYWGGY